MTPTLPRLTVTVFCWIVAGSVNAEPGAAPQAATRDEIRYCIQADEDLAAMRLKVQTGVAAHQQVGVDLQADSDALKGTQKAAAAGDASKIAEFNRRIELHNARTREMNATAALLDTELERVNTATRDYNARCAGLRMLAPDRAAVLKERGNSSK